MRSVRIRHTLILCTLAALLLTAFPAVALAAPPAERLASAAAVLQEMSQQSDVETMARLVRKAKGIAIFPTQVKVGLMVGVRYGEGLVLRHDPEKNAWYGPNFVKLKGVSYGPQIGFQSTALVLVITNEQGMKGFRGDKVTLGGDVGVAAGPVGRHAEASTDADLKASIYSYSMSKGMFAGASLEGAVITADDPANEAYWGSAAPPDALLTKPAARAEVQALLNALAKLAARGK